MRGGYRGRDQTIYTQEDRRLTYEQRQAANGRCLMPSPEMAVVLHAWFCILRGMYIVLLLVK